MPKGENEPVIEETAQVLEQFVDAVSLPTDSEGLAPDIPNRYWASDSPQRHEQKLALIRKVIDSLPEREIMHALYEIFATRCQGPLGNIVHTPSFIGQADQLGEILSMASPDTIIANTFSMESLAGLLLALVLGLAFFPSPSLLGFIPTPLTSRVLQLRESDERAAIWRSLAVRCLQGGISLFCGSVSSLQAAIMLLLEAKETTLELDAVLATAIVGARRLKMHRLGNPGLTRSAFSAHVPGTAELHHIRTEIAIRIWWALVMRDWSRGQALGYYTITPSQFNTRMPLHINDEDLLEEHGEISERPRSEFTMLSYTVHALEMCIIVRESIDIAGDSKTIPMRRQQLDERYERYVASLPSHFTLGSFNERITTVGPIDAMIVQRCMLHQQLWSLLLSLHRSTLLAPTGRSFCQHLAHHIITIQAQIQSRCTVCGSLTTNDLQVFNAAVLLVVGLIFDFPSGKQGLFRDKLTQDMTRARVQEAIDLLRCKIPLITNSRNVRPQDPLQNLSARGVMVLEALMKLEEDSHHASERHASSNPKRYLYRQVVEILQGLGCLIGPAVSPGQMLSSLDDTSFTLSMPATDDLHDLDVMPILSNNLSPSDMWDFLDFQLSEDVAHGSDLLFTGNEYGALDSIKRSGPS
ncbi:unnamed protein product [Penicillium salamii]|nr:unnamed protein product [Penicillium salamii]CAG8363334.1 unnamed protein product [Penicillium salamii]